MEYDYLINGGQDFITHVTYGNRKQIRDEQRINRRYRPLGGVVGTATKQPVSAMSVDP